jgi:hypothetical protein
MPGSKPQLRQLNQPSAFAGTDLSDDTIGNARGNKTIHHQAPHARGPSRIPPAGNHPQKQIARKQRRRDHDLAAMAATLLSQQWLVDLITSQCEAVQLLRLSFSIRWVTRPGAANGGLVWN